MANPVTGDVANMAARAGFALMSDHEDYLLYDIKGRLLFRVDTNNDGALNIMLGFLHGWAAHCLYKG